MSTPRGGTARSAGDEGRFLRLIESFAQAVWEADSQGNLLPGSWPQLTGQDEAACAGRGWLNAVHPDDRREVETAWNQAVADGRVYHREYRIRDNKLGWVWTLAHAAPLVDDQGKALSWLGMNVDISGQKNAEHALMEADRQKDVFISILAHELRNPLAPLRSGIDLMLNDTATSAAKARALALMSRQTFHLSRLVEDLIDASRITTGKLHVQLQPTRLSEVVRGAVSSIEPAANAKRQRMVVVGLDACDPMLSADPVRLNQAFMNILNNSTKFSPEHSTINLDITKQESHVAIVIRDRGRGIPAPDLPNIFKLFVQSARHDRGDGLGIGLALANDIIKLHGGTIEARSGNNDIGAEFVIELPVTSFFDNPRTSVDSTHAPGWGSLRVLIVDDNADAAESLGALLELSGHTIRIVHGGIDAVREAPSFVPQVIFMDVGMPDIGGLEATRRIRALNLAVRPFIVALTGWNSEPDRAASRDAGCDMHLSKPASFSAIAAALEQIET